MLSFSDFKERVHAPKAARMSQDRLYYLSRMVSVGISYFLSFFFPRIRPNQVSVSLNIILLVVLLTGVAYHPLPPQALIFLHLFLLGLVSIGDRVDGELARFQSYFTQAGIYYDRVFHYLYPFALYVSVGSYMAHESSLPILLDLAWLLALLGSLANMLGKLRHHIRFKLELEGQVSNLRDLLPEAPKNELPPLSYFKKFWHYTIFMMYDWVLGLYGIVAALSLWSIKIATWVYVTHLLISLIVIFTYVLISYPRRYLFSRSDFGLS